MKALESGALGSNAAVALAKLLTDELGIVVTAAQVRAIINDRWSRLSILAHAVHDEVSAEAQTN